MKIPPPPRISQFALAFFNLAIFVISIIMIVGGASTLAGYSSVLQADLQQLSSSLSDFISPEMAKQLTDMINYAPKVLVLVGTFLALISFAGCCGSFSKSRTLLRIYSVLVLVLLLGQLAVIGYAAQRGEGVETAAGEIAADLWDKRCLCLDEGPACTPSPTECLHPDTPVPCPPGIDPAACVVQCRPCKDYLESTVCAAPELQTAGACGARVQSLVAANLHVMCGVLVGALVLQAGCLLAAGRILRWLRDRDMAERAEEALLAETYRIHRGIPYPGPPAV